MLNSDWGRCIVKDKVRKDNSVLVLTRYEILLDLTNAHNMGGWIQSDSCIYYGKQQREFIRSYNGLQIAEAMDSVTSDSYLVSKVSGLSDCESSSSWALHSTSTGGRRSILSRPWESWRTATAWASGRGPGWWGWPARGCRACRGCTPAASRGVMWILSIIITCLPRTPQSRQCWATTAQWQERLFQECSQQRSLKRHQECFGWSHLYSKRFEIF